MLPSLIIDAALDSWLSVADVELLHRGLVSAYFWLVTSWTTVSLEMSVYIVYILYKECLIWNLSFVCFLLC